MVFVKGNIGKVDEKHEAENCSSDGHEAEDDKDPAPTFQSAQPSLIRLIMCIDSGEEVEWVIPFVGHHTPEYRNIRMLQAQDCRRLRTASAYHIERTCLLVSGQVRSSMPAEGWETVPSGDEVDHSWKVSGFKQTQEQSQWDKHNPVLDKAEPNLISSAILCGLAE